jgi:hypothetical protein
MPRKRKTEPQEPSKPERKQLVWLSGKVKTPPFTAEGRMEAGELLRALQEGQAVSMPHAEPLPTSVRDVVHCEFVMLVKTGESCTGSI